ncbi:CMGC/CDK/CRK7 protein kinase [Ephemerocybe angulata]|uniref:CMGC/CDK/CRK7 protein kinase n=1 Tax=Ephemerocybe angulata TaxID=980116 RepID=A0A8H6IB78_9AGAR|nr:CMGC/CDK/CRK7 protein kinase [Tulosesus angulatus]
MSSERSRSRSPGGGHRRAVHRLPAAPPAHVPTAGPTKSEKKSRKSKKKKNGHDQSHRVDDKRQRYTDPEPKLAEIALPMHPPPAPQTFSHDRVAEPLLVERSSKMVYPPPQATLQPELPTRIVPPRTIGFKPIGKTNSALKRFFPGDDDDGEQAEVAEHRDPPSAPPASTAHFPQAAYGHGTNGHYGQNGFGAPYQVPPHGRGKWPAIPHNVALAMENGYRQHYTQLPGLPPPPHPTEATQLWNQPIPNWLPDSVPPRPIPAQPTWSQPPIAPTVPLAPEQAQQPPPYSPVQQSPTYSPYVSPSNMAPASFNVSPNQEPQAGRDVGLPPHFSESETRRAAPEPESKKTVTSSKELYAILNQVGEGTFGKVYKAQNTASKLYVALKRIRMETERDGFPVTAMREIKLLQSLKHQNVVRLHEMMVSNGSVFMVFEYMDHDLTGILSQNQFKFSDAHLKSLCHQMLAGLAYLHHKGVIHRDIKGSNILLNNRGELKLADFGLARFYQKRRRSDYTNRVITLWYRPPELLFGATIYGAEVDMWSAGCIMLELFTKKPVFQGNDEINQLQVIFKILGTPTPDRWLGLLNLPWYELVKPREALPNRFRDLFSKWMSPAALDLAERLLTYDPSQRVSAQDAMDAPYFTQEGPSAEPPTGLSTLEGEWHELETKVERQKKRKKESAA